MWCGWLDLKCRSGPVWVGFQYTFEANLEPLFMTKMSKNRRVSLASTSIVNLMIGLRLLRWWWNCCNLAAPCGQTTSVVNVSEPFSVFVVCCMDRLCGLVVRVSGYRSRGPGFDSRTYQIFWQVRGLERGPLSLVITSEELLEKRSSGSGLENRD
jgi:hypothetical protein